MDASARIEHSGNCVVVHAAGEFNLATARILSAALDDAVAAGSNVVLDLADTTFMDLTAVRVLCDGQLAARAHGRQIVLLDTPAAARRIIDVLALGDVLPTAS